MLVDSHCHLNRIDLSQFDNQLDNLFKLAEEADIGHFLSVCVELEEYPVLCELASRYKNVSISIGLHPAHDKPVAVDAELLIKLAKQHPSCVALGETGLDYYHVNTEALQEAQRALFREHIRASLAVKKPLIIHTRNAPEDTLQIMAEENADRIGGVMHCFSEDLAIAERAMALGFYISLSGIVTFKNAKNLHEVAKKIPLDRLLIETDAPYLAPVPFRGKQNHPALVKYTALSICELREISYAELAEKTTENFKRCFRIQDWEQKI